MPNTNPLPRQKKILEEIDALKTRQAEDKKRQTELELEYLGLVKDGGPRTLEVEVPDALVTGTLVEGTRLILDEPKLKKTLGAAKFKKVTKEVLDRSLLDDAIHRGAVAASDVAKCSEEVSNKPYVKITRKAKPKAKPSKTVKRRAVRK